MTNELEVPKDILWITVYEEDEEAYNIWVNDVGVSPERVVKLGKADNFWELDQGPCGPCSEIHVDRGFEFDPREDAKPGDEGEDSWKYGIWYSHNSTKPLTGNMKELLIQT